MAKLMHVAYGGTGGVARVVVDIARHHDMAYFKPVVVLVGYEVDPKYLLELEERGIRGVALLKQKKWDWRFLFRLRAVIAEHRPDAVFLHTPVASFWGRLALPGLGVKKVISVEHSAATGCYGWVGRVVNLLQSHLLTDKVICVSEAVKANVIRELRLRESKTLVIENGIPLDRYPRADPCALLTGRPVRVKMVSRLDAGKDPATLIRAVQLLQEQGFEIKLDFVGDGNLRRDMEELARQTGLQNQVSFLGMRSDIAALLLDTDVFVLSTHGEGLPVALLEAMAAGLPCIATAVAGNKDVIQDQVTGLLVPENDATTLAEAIAFLIEQPHLARRLAGAARAGVEERYNIVRVAREYEKLLGEAVARGSSAWGG